MALRFFRCQPAPLAPVALQFWASAVAGSRPGVTAEGEPPTSNQGTSRRSVGVCIPAWAGARGAAQRLPWPRDTRVIFSPRNLQKVWRWQRLRLPPRRACTSTFHLSARILCASCCKGQFDPERGSAPCLRLKVDRAIVKLNDAKGRRQSDPAATRACGEKQLENFLPVFERDTLAGVGDADFRHFAATSKFDAQFAA